jgi:uncharacterized membrane protein YcaP (DUF421 family)
MGSWLTTDWSKLFTPRMSLPEILVRGTLIYLALCLLLRVFLKRQAGGLSLSDVLVVTLVAGLCRNPLVADDYSITDGLLMVLTVLVWSYVLDWLSYHVRLIHRLSHAPRLHLIHDGATLEENLRRELMTHAQLESKLRAAGVHRPQEVADAYLESDGQVTVLKKDPPASTSLWAEQAHED